MNPLNKFAKTLTFLGTLTIVFTNSATGQVDLNKTDPQRASAAIILEQPLDDPRVKNRQHELVSSIATSGDGKEIFIAWYTGGKGEGPGNYVTLAVSLDNGKTWKNDQLVVYPKEPATRFFDPVLWRDKNGKVWLFYAVGLKTKEKQIWDLKGGVNAVSIAWDGKKVTHTKPVLLSYGIMMNKPVYVPQKDIALFPVSVWQLGKDNSREPEYVPDGTFVHSIDYKKKQSNSLTPYASVPVLHDSMRTFDEHQVVQTSDNGEMLCLVRTKKEIYYSRSTDFGRSWTTLLPFTASGPTTSARFYIGKLKSGNLILILNSSKARNSMTAFVSSDGGKTWPHKLLIDNQEMISYPDVAQTPDGLIHVTYDHDRSGAKDIFYCRFMEDDVISGNTGKIFKTKVNPKP
jgi:hypothetical protein